jgi:cold-inducible RNA-binding protein
LKVLQNLAAHSNLPRRARTIERLKDLTDMKNIFVGNLDFSATDSSLRSLFEPYGNVERVNVVTDRDTGRSRGFAFVEMTDAAQADAAIAALNGANLDGRALNINEAKPKTTGGGGGGGFSRGGGGVGGGRQQRSRW